MQNWRIQTNHWFGLIFMIMVLVVIFFILRGVFQILSWAAPFLFILALIINYKTVIGYGAMLLRLLKDRTLLGVLAVILTIVGFPVVAAYLFGRSLVDRKIRLLGREYEKQRENEYVDFEDVTSENDEDILELPDMKEEKQKRSDYDDFFEP
jgi:predicted membrane protein